MSQYFQNSSHINTVYFTNLFKLSCLLQLNIFFTRIRDLSWIFQGAPQNFHLFEISLCPYFTNLLYFEYLSGGVLSSSGMHVKSSGFLFRESRPGSTLTGRKLSVCSEFLSTINIVNWEIRIHFNLYLVKNWVR